MRIKKPKTIDTEAGLHRFTHQLLKLTAFANVQYLHIPNGLQRAPRVAAMLKGMGAKNGAADFLVIVRGRAHWLELKNGKKGKLSPDQEAFREEARRAGATFECESCSEKFWRKPRDIKAGDCRFCSRGCYQSWQRGRTKPVSPICTKRGLAAAAALKAAQTHCKRGHLLGGDNLFRTSSGARGCKECRKIHKRTYREKSR